MFRHRVFIVGGGPSLRGFDFSRLRGMRVFAINAAGYDVPFAELLIFDGHGFYRKHSDLIDGWSGSAVTRAPPSRLIKSDRVQFVGATERPDFGPGLVKSGPSTGHLAVGLAVQRLAQSVVLLGFDCANDEAGRSHYHDRYNGDGDRFLETWGGWNAAARRAGVDVVNASPCSALTEFRLAHIDSILGAP